MWIVVGAVTRAFGTLGTVWARLHNHCKMTPCTIRFLFCHHGAQTGAGMGIFSLALLICFSPHLFLSAFSLAPPPRKKTSFKPDSTASLQSSCGPFTNGQRNPSVIPVAPVVWSVLCFIHALPLGPGPWSLSLWLRFSLPPPQHLSPTSHRIWGSPH